MMVAGPALFWDEVHSSAEMDFYCLSMLRQYIMEVQLYIMKDPR